MQAGTKSSLTFDKLDWTQRENNTLTFDLAYRQYQGENDRLQVMISTDCGVTWQSAYNKAGSALSTVGAATAFFVPTTASQWRTETVDLAAWDGASDVIVQFLVTSAYGNNMYFDNINIAGTVVSGVEDAIVGSNVNVFPNPASSVVNIEFNMVKSNNVSVQVYDVAGKLVTTLLDNQVLGAGAQNLQWNNPTSNGLYFVKIRTEEGEVTRKVSVLK